MSKKLGAKIREARNDAGLTQEQLARKIRSLSASDISKIERGEKEPTQEQIKQIAKATGVTQKSLLDLAKKTSSTSSSGKTSTAAKSAMQVTATERRLVELYRAADSKSKQAAMKVLRGTTTTTDAAIGELFGSAVEMILGKNDSRSLDAAEDDLQLADTSEE
ncbi:MAG: helix-turn-helix domain-containing protein [Lachnospiraceae bacterium]|nr:helix-turn-helix domain-containing protein [Lachnospiraceae bacterium]